MATEDRAATLKMIAEHHLPSVNSPLKIEAKVTWLYIAGPDNNVIEFVQWLA